MFSAAAAPLLIRLTHAEEMVITMKMNDKSGSNVVTPDVQRE